MKTRKANPLRIELLEWADFGSMMLELDKVFEQVYPGIKEPEKTSLKTAWNVGGKVANEHIRRKFLAYINKKEAEEGIITASPA
jgi:hypothetical protein